MPILNRQLKQQFNPMKKKNKDVLQNEPEFVINKDGERVELLKNPLPLPKKKSEVHKIDFDIEISENDDFDYKGE